MTSSNNRLLGLMRRNLFSATCSIVSLLLGAGTWVLWQDVRTNEALNRERSQEFESMLSTMVSGPLIRQELGRGQDTVKRIESTLIVESKLEENVGYFYKIQARTKADVLGLRQQSPESSNNSSDYIIIPFSLQLAGTYEQVAAFLLELETGPKLVQVKSFSFRRREQGANSVSLNLELRLLGKR